MKTRTGGRAVDRSITGKRKFTDVGSAAPMSKFYLRLCELRYESRRALLYSLEKDLGIAYSDL